MEELAQLSRIQLQALAKEHGIKANQKTDALIQDLSSVINSKDVMNTSEPSEGCEDGTSQVCNTKSSFEPEIVGSTLNDTSSEIPSAFSATENGDKASNSSLEAVRNVSDWTSLESEPVTGKALEEKVEKEAHQEGSKVAAKSKKELPLPRVATLKHPQSSSNVAPRRRSDRFAELHKVRDGPAATTYNPTSKASGGRVVPFSSGNNDRFAGHDSRYRKGLRKSTMHVHDPEVYRAKQPDENTPLPHVAGLTPHNDNIKLPSSNERFAGYGSIYSSSETPAPTKYNVTASGGVGSNPISVPSFDKSSSERFAGPHSIHAVPEAPAATAYYVPASQLMGSQSLLVPSFEKTTSERFADSNSIYRKGLRRSTIPEQRCLDLAARPLICKLETAKGASFKRGAALKAALKATLLGAVVE